VQSVQGFVPLATQAPPPHLRFEIVDPTVLALFCAVEDGFGRAMAAAVPDVAALPVAPFVTALPVEPGVGATPTTLGLITLPTAAGFAPTEAGEDAPTSTGAGFAKPPIVFGFVFTAPPMAFWAMAGFETAMESAMSTNADTVTLIFIGYPCLAPGTSAPGRTACP